MGVEHILDFCFNFYFKLLQQTFAKSILEITYNLEKASCQIYSSLEVQATRKASKTCQYRTKAM